MLGLHHELMVWSSVLTDRDTRGGEAATVSYISLGCCPMRSSQRNQPTRL
jgi:hypothetical protein